MLVVRVVVDYTYEGTVHGGIHLKGKCDCTIRLPVIPEVRRDQALFFFLFYSPVLYSYLFSRSIIPFWSIVFLGSK